MIRLLQYRLEEEGVTYSEEQIMDGLNSLLALVQGIYPKVVITPTRVPQAYLEMARLLGLPNLMTNMSMTQFRSATKLDLSDNLS